MPNYQPNLRDSLLKGPGSLEVLVASNNVAYYVGRAKAVSSTNKIGPFDILPQHENFISLIYDKVIVVDERGEEHDFVCQSGLLEVSENRVRVFIGI